MKGIVKLYFIASSPHIVYKSYMPTEKPKIILVLEDDLLERIEDFRYENRIPSRSDAIRQLIEKGLKAPDAPKTKSRKNK